MNRLKYLMKNVGLLTISNFSSKILVFLLVPLYTSVLSTAEYGTYDIIISTVALLYPIFTLNIIDAVMRFIMDKDYPKKSVVSIGLKYVVIGMIPMTLMCFIFYLSKIWSGLLVFFALYYIFYVFNQFFIQLAKGLEKVQDMAIAGVLSTLSLIMFNLLFLLGFRLGLEGFFTANVLSQLISAVYLAFKTKFWHYIVINENDSKIKKEMFVYCIPLIATTLGWWVNNTLDKYAVTFFCGVAANGLLSVSYKIPSILNVIQGIFIQAWQISAIKVYDEDGTKEFYGATFSIVNMIMCIACSILILLTKPIAMVLYSNDFYAAWEYVPFLLVSSVFNCASGLLGPVLSAKKNTNNMMWSAIIGAGINAVANICLIYLIGIQGATIATMISSLVIYIVRRYGVGSDIKMVNKYYLTWILLLIQSCVEIVKGDFVVEVLICMAVIGINKKNIDIIRKTIKGGI